jgi:hypothetical protein
MEMEFKIKKIIIKNSKRDSNRRFRLRVKMEESRLIGHVISTWDGFHPI